MSDILVLDASALIQGYVDEPHSEHVLALLERIQPPTETAVHCPIFCLLECTNVLWRHVRFNQMPPDVAQHAIQNLLSLTIQVHPAHDYLSEAFSIGLTHQLAMYDAIYIALAQSLGATLVTADQKQAQAAEANGVAVLRAADLDPPA